jgi:hypothetical protein
MTIFRYSLKENVKDELIYNSSIIDLLDILIRIAIDIDNKLYKRAIEKKHNFNSRGTFGFNSGIKDNRSRDSIDLSTT